MALFSSVAPYAKAIVGFITPGVVILAGALLDASPGGGSITPAEWAAVAVACLTTGTVVYATPNKQPDK